jgi:hypothetical protein
MGDVSCFKVIKAVLDEQYEMIPTGPIPRDKLIDIKRRRLRRIFRRLATSAERADYSSPATRFAYVYTYVTSHANCLYQLIEDSSDLTEVFDQQSVEIACIGGGPGSDFMGVLKFMLAYDKKPDKLICQILDGESGWSDTWRDVDDKLPTPVGFNLSTYFDVVNVADQQTWEPYEKYLGSALFTLSYFMSELWHAKAEAEPFFDNLFGRARPGALFLYLDNRGMSAWFDELAARHGLEFLAAECKRISLAPLSEEEKTDLGVYYQKFGWPKMTADVDYRICLKPDAAEETPF